MAVPNTFATATTAIPLANLDANFAYYDTAFSISGAATTFLGGVTLSTGTANGVAYLNGSKVVTTGSALTFDGTNFATTGNATLGGGSKATDTQLNFSADTGTQRIYIERGSRSLVFYDVTSAIETYRIAGISGAQTWTVGGTRTMDLTSTGLGIGTSSPAYKLDVLGSFARVYSNSSTTQAVIATGRTQTFGDSQFGTAGTAGDIVSGSASGDTGINANGASLRILFGINGTQKAILDSSGSLGIGTSSPAASAILDAQSTTKGVRMPNMTTTQKNAIASPAAGLIVFDTTLAKLCVYSGAAWQTITSI